MLPVWKQSSLTESIFRVIINGPVIVTSSAIDYDVISRTKTERVKTGTMYKESGFFSSFIDSIYRIRNKIMYVLSWKTVSALTRVLFWHSLPSLLRNSGNKHQNNPLTSAETVRHPSTDIIFYLITVRWPSLYMVFRYFRCIFNIKPRSI